MFQIKTNDPDSRPLASVVFSLLKRSRDGRPLRPTGPSSFECCGANGEVVVSGNGSIDGSPTIAVADGRTVGFNDRPPRYTSRSPSLVRGELSHLDPTRSNVLGSKEISDILDEIRNHRKSLTEILNLILRSDEISIRLIEHRTVMRMLEDIGQLVDQFEKAFHVVGPDRKLMVAVDGVAECLAGISDVMNAVNWARRTSLD
jgi:hypothetical protein